MEFPAQTVFGCEDPTFWFYDSSDTIHSWTICANYHIILSKVEYAWLHVKTGSDPVLKTTERAILNPSSGHNPKPNILLWSRIISSVILAPLPDSSVDYCAPPAEIRFPPHPRIAAIHIWSSRVVYRCMDTVWSGAESATKLDATFGYIAREWHPISW